MRFPRFRTVVGSGLCDFGNLVYAKLQLAQEISDRTAADQFIQAEITGIYNSYITVMQGQITTLNNEMSALGTGWQTLPLDNTNVVVTNGTGTINSIAGRFDYMVIGKTVTATYSVVFSITGMVTGIDVILPTAITWPGYDSGDVAMDNAGHIVGVYLANNTNLLKLNAESLFPISPVLIRGAISAQIQ